MNFIDKAISMMSPGWAVSRLRSRAVIKAYEAAIPTRTHKIKRENRNANQLNQIAGKSLREQARWFDNNHDLVVGALDKMEERIIGAKGIIVEPQPLTVAGTLNQELAEQIRTRWVEWSVSPDVTGQYTRPVLERLLLRTWLRDGEVFSQMVAGKMPGLEPVAGVPFWLEAMEPDYVPMEKTDSANNLIQGIYFNDWQRPKSYIVCKSWPGFATAMVATKLIDAENMLHLKFTRRLNQARGVTLLAPVIIRLLDLKEYEDSERLAARISAAFAMFIRRSDAMVQDGDAPDYADKDRDLDIEPGTILKDLLPGEDIGTIKSDRPNANLESFRMGQLRAVAAGVRGSFSSIARNYDGTYSAQRQELVEAQEGYAILQDNFIAAVSRPVYRRWLATAITAGVIDVPPDTDMATLFNAVYSGPVMPWIDPLKEANAWRVLIRGGAATESDWVRARGGAPAEVKRRRKAEIDENRKLGLVFDTDPAHDPGEQDNAGNEDNGGSDKNAAGNDSRERTRGERQ
ncbi:phage portal protein [Salmonella enterica]|uniref:phage portal protein n=1 Tax=Salmonella enterica TaxID=28901 RepID=UPI001649DAC9|nr:phage portal protein [Salmonella enterica]EJP9668330.1 phage portal protein [Salmonella enterica]